MNKVLLIGRLGADPELNHTPTGAAVLQISLATSQRFKDKAGNTQEKTEWHRLVFWNRSAEIVHEFCKKGSQICVEGALQTRDWTDRDNSKRYTTEVIVNRLELLGSRPGESKGGSAAPLPDDSGMADFDDDIPF